MSIRAALIYSVIRKKLAPFAGNESAYIEKNLQGQNFGPDGMRETAHVPSAGFKFEREQINGVNLEHVYVEGSKPVKVIYQLHGGAYTMALTDMYAATAERYADGGRFEVYTIDYRVAPADPFPAALEDALAGYQALLNKGYKAEDIIFAGDSAGGNLAVALTFKLRELGMELPKTLVLSSPWVDLSEVFTAEQKANDLSFGWGNVLEMCAEGYANGHDAKDPYISPVFGDFSGFEGMNVYISTAQNEMLERAGVLMAEKMKKAGAKVELDRMKSGMHAIIVMTAMGWLPEVKTAWKHLNDYLRKVTA